MGRRAVRRPLVRADRSMRRRSAGRPRLRLWPRGRFHCRRLHGGLQRPLREAHHRRLQPLPLQAVRPVHGGRAAAAASAAAAARARRRARNAGVFLRICRSRALEGRLEGRGDHHEASGAGRRDPHRLRPRTARGARRETGLARGGRRQRAVRVRGVARRRPRPFREGHVALGSPHDLRTLVPVFRPGERADAAHLVRAAAGPTDAARKATAPATLASDAAAASAPSTAAAQPAAPHRAAAAAAAAAVAAAGAAPGVEAAGQRARGGARGAAARLGRPAAVVRRRRAGVRARAATAWSVPATGRNGRGQREQDRAAARECRE